MRHWQVFWERRFEKTDGKNIDKSKEQFITALNQVEKKIVSWNEKNKEIPVQKGRIDRVNEKSLSILTELRTTIQNAVVEEH